MITLCSVYLMPQLSIDSDEVKHLSAKYDYGKMLNCISESLRWYNNDIKFVVLTDRVTKVNGHDTFRMDMKGKMVMESFVNLQTQFIKERIGSSKLLLTGTDHIVAGDIGKVFDRTDFDVAVPISKNKNFTDSFIIVNDENPDKVNDFFKRRIDVYRKLDWKERSWFGSQDSYKYVMQPFNDGDHWDHKVYDIYGTRVLLFKHGGDWLSHFKYKINEANVDDFPLLLDCKGRAKDDYNYWFKLLKRKYENSCN